MKGTAERFLITIFLTIGLNPTIVLSENSRHINIGIGDIPGIETLNIEAVAALTRECGISVEEMLKVWRKINHNPSYILELRAKYNLLPHLSNRKTDRLEKYYSEMASIGSFPMNGGGANAVHADFAFYTYAGTIQRNSRELKIEDFWDLKPLNIALDRLGIVKLQ